jgi:hypothetical protein
MDIRQTEVHGAVPPMPTSSALDFEMAVDKIRSRILPCIDQVPAKLITAGVRTFRSEIHRLILFGIKGNGLKKRRGRSWHIFITRVIKGTVVIIDVYHF